MSDLVDAWLASLIARHTAELSRPQFFKAIRALSARYVESRGRLPDRSPIDSAGKRAAFAAFYAPLHFLTVREIVRASAADVPAMRTVESIVDLGCGTGVAGAAWALQCDRAAPVRGIDKDGWSLSEVSWNWRHLHVEGTTQRADMIAAADHLARRPLGRTGVVLGWSANEVATNQRPRLFDAVTRLASRGATILIVEPIARSATPWWPEWAKALTSSFPQTRANDWKFEVELPSALGQISESAGFKERALSARTILIGQ